MPERGYFPFTSNLAFYEPVKISSNPHFPIELLEIWYEAALCSIIYRKNQDYFFFWPKNYFKTIFNVFFLVNFSPFPPKNI